MQDAVLPQGRIFKHIKSGLGADKVHFPLLMFSSSARIACIARRVTRSLVGAVAI